MKDTNTPQISKEAREAANKMEAAFHCDGRDVKRFSVIIQSAIDRALSSVKEEEKEDAPNGEAPTAQGTATGNGLEATVDALWKVAHSMFLYENNENDGPHLDYNRETFKKHVRAILKKARRVPQIPDANHNAVGSSVEREAQSRIQSLSPEMKNKRGFSVSRKK
jgi:hypothetical protein